MALHPLAGKPAPPEMLINVPRLVADYYSRKPDPAQVMQKVSFGTSGHRGSASQNSFNEDHILAISQAICEYRKSQGATGPIYLGMDTHALSEPAIISALEVFAAHGLYVMFPKDMEYTPTPVISHAILTYNRGRKEGFADGVVITPSHNPPGDGGFKYNPPSGGPAGTDATKTIEDRANRIMLNGNKEVVRITYEKALKSGTVTFYDYIIPYIRDLENVLDMEAIAKSRVKIGVDPLGGAGLNYWEPMAEMYGLNLTLTNKKVDPTFSFMTVDKDGKIRMDCSSPYAMAGLIDLKDQYDIAFGNDPDTDRHGIVTSTAGLMNPNHYLSVAIDYLYSHRTDWPHAAQIGKTLVSSSMIDRVAAKLGRTVCEVPVGFKWFVDGLLDGSFGFGGEESAGASFLRKDGTVWSTDKDGIILNLLAAEILAVTGKDPAQHYAALVEELGDPVYERIQAPASLEQKSVLKNLSSEQVTASQMAGEPITAKLTKAPGNHAAIGGLKVTTENGWFAARPSGTEEIYKIYAESFKGAEHLKRIQEEAQEIVSAAFSAAGL